GEEADRNLLDNVVGGGIYHSHAVVTVAGDVEESPVRAESGTGREGDVRTCRTVELRRSRRFVAAGICRIEGGVRGIVGNKSLVTGQCGENRDPGWRASGDNPNSGDGEQLHIVIRPSGGPYSIGPAAGYLESDKESGTRTEPRYHFHGCGIDHRKRVAAGIGRVLRRDQATFALVVIAGNDEFVIRGNSHAERVRPDLNRGSCWPDNAAIRK